MTPTPRQLKRLHNMVQVLRDAAKDARLRRLFTMERFGWGASASHTCGSPACALGNYAIRRDVQRTFVLNEGGDVRAGNRSVSYKRDVTKHFGITSRQAAELFEATGCDRARTPTQAANYIERFIKRITA